MERPRNPGVRASSACAAALVALLALPAAGALPPTLPPLPACDHALHPTSVHGGPVTMKVEGVGWRLVDAGRFVIDPQSPGAIEVAGVSQGDPYSRYLLLLVNGHAIAAGGISGSGFSDGASCPVLKVATAVVGGSFARSYRLADHLPPEELAAPVDVQVGLTTFVGSWSVSVRTCTGGGALCAAAANLLG